MMSNPMYKIKVVGRLTDLSPHVIRAWEKRYGIIKPHRTETNRRLYSDQEVEKLRLLSRLTSAGHAISDLADANLEQLHHLVQELNAAEHALPDERDIPTGDLHRAEEYLDACVEATLNLNGDKLERLLQQASVSLSKPRLLDDMISPLMRRIGEMWQAGDLRIAHEHLASAVVRTFLSGLLGSYRSAPQAPTLVVCTLTGQHHELGSLMVSVRAASMGWRVTYLGANLPAEEIASAALQLDARAVAISLVHPPGDSQVEQEIERLRKGLPKLSIIAGGRAADSYAKQLKKQGIVRLDSLNLLVEFLKNLQSAPR